MDFFFARRYYSSSEEHVGECGGSLMILVKEIDIRDWECGQRTNVLWRKYTELYNEVGRSCRFSQHSFINKGAEKDRSIMRRICWPQSSARADKDSDI